MYFVSGFFMQYFQIIKQKILLKQLVGLADTCYADSR